MENEIIPVEPGQHFRFACSQRVRCFNECCRDLNQSLTPYDVLRLKRGLGMDSGEFLAAYTRQHLGPETGLPVVTLEPAPGPERKCPFVTREGCRVYEDRPASCRTYPLVRLLSRDRATGRMTERYFLMREAHCFGFAEERMQTPEGWIESQGIGPYNEINDLLMGVIAARNRLDPGPLLMGAGRLFYSACYDIDAFRARLRENGGEKEFDVDSAVRNAIECDDTVFLKAVLEWMPTGLFQRTEKMVKKAGAVR